MSQNRKGQSTITPTQRQTEADKLRQNLHKTGHPVNIPEREWREQRTQRIDHKIADKIAKQQAEAEARRKYHTAWQEYYQKYYEHYYLAQLESQKRQVITASGESKQLSPRQQAIDNLRKDLIKKISDSTDKAIKSQHFKPIMAGVIVIILFIFIQYNQLFTASVQSFVSPGTDSSSNIIIASGANQPINSTPTILIPKINVKAPIIFGLDDLSEASAQRALETGVINFPVTGANSVPGQNGNTVILGHSSGDIFNNGQFKFIFVQLNRLSSGDLFYIDFNNIRYTYEITDRKVVAPTDLSTLNLGNNAPFATLATCDPPGTPFNRLLVFGKQISPNPNSASVNNNIVVDENRNNIPGNPPTLFELLFR
jgi:LPXTG-site transpeptidase (sortase) family protein